MYHGTLSKPSSVSGEIVATQRYCNEQVNSPKLMRVAEANGNTERNTGSCGR